MINMVPNKKTKDQRLNEVSYTIFRLKKTE